MTTPCIVLDVPHQWSAWTKRALVGADDILIVAEPDLANLRNAKNMLSMLKTARPNDRPPLYCLNQVGMPKRPEIDAREFAKAIESPPIAAIPFDSRMFGTAANNGQMIAEISASHRTTEMFLQIAQQLTGRGETKKPRGSLLSPIIRKLRAKQVHAWSAAAVRERNGSRTMQPGGHTCSIRAADGRRRQLSRLRTRILLPRQQSPQISDIRRRLLGRPIGLHNAFSLGKTALQANHQRQILPHPRIRIRTAIRAAQSFFRLGQDLLKGRRKDRDWTALKVLRARFSARSRSTAVLRRYRPS